MISRCCCICHEDTLAAIQGGIELFTAQTGIRLETEWFSDHSEFYHWIVESSCQVVIIALPGAARASSAA